jgi:diguanylate cyclase (GGDEF)-like protein/PAS domain S-box-containing protein
MFTSEANSAAGVAAAAEAAELRLRADRDLADRSAAGIWAFFVLWAGFVALTDAARAYPVAIYALGALMFAVGALRYALRRGFARHYARDPRRWQRGFAFGVVASALLWATFTGLVLLRGVVDETAMLVLVATASIGIGAVVGLTPHRGLQLTSVSLLMLVPVLMLVARGSGSSWLIALLLLVYWVYAVQMGGRLHREYRGAERAVLREERESQRLAQANAAQRETMIRLQALIANTPSGVLFEDAARRIVLANQDLCTLFGIAAAPESLVGMDGMAAAEQVKALFADSEAFIADTVRRVTQQREVLGEELRLADGRVFERDYIPVLSGGEFYGHLWQFRDISERKKSEAELLHLAHYDPLTRLANRTLFRERLRLALAHARRSQRTLAVLFADLDGFKEINDSLGHAAGDEVLRTVAERLRAAVRDTDAVARFGGDEFAVLVEDTAGEQDVERVVNKLLRMVAEPILLAGGTRAVTASIGISTYPDHGAGEDELLERADVAMYRAKQAGKNTWRFYEA